MRIRKSAPERREQLLKAALELSREHGYLRVTRHMIADACNCSPSLIPAYWSTMAQLRRDILRHAFRLGYPDVRNQGVAMGDLKS